MVLWLFCKVKTWILITRSGKIGCKTVKNCTNVGLARLFVKRLNNQNISPIEFINNSFFFFEDVVPMKKKKEKCKPTDNRKNANRI